jgi:predicted O-linked N-acetylglucosamine transferase (SPINDLY family)
MISYLGYPNTTGLRAIDARLTDAIADPPGAEALHVERLIRLEPCAWCYAPPTPEAPDRCPEPALTENLRDAGAPVTFGSFNSVFKVSPAIIALWARVVNEVPGSRLVLKADYRLSGPRGRILAELARAGVGADRVTILPMTMDTRAHLETYARVDVALDSFPYTGTTTTCEALHMGVPVVSLASREPRHAARVGLSLLTTLGLTDWVTFEPDEYVRRAVKLAHDRELRRTLRTDLEAGLRARLAASPLGDGPGFTRGFERAIREAWRAWCLG